MWRLVWQNFRLGQKHSVTLLLQFLTCVLNRVKFLDFFFFFFRLCAVGLWRPFTVKPNWVRGDCPVPSLAEGPINQGIHRLSHLCLPSSWLRPSAFRLWVFTAQMYPSTPPSGRQPPSRLSDRWVRCTLPLGLCAALSAWEGVRGTSF